jgi:hypothetical protein
MSRKELKAAEQAEIVKLINMTLPQLDIDFLKQAAKDMRGDALRYESAAVLNPNFNPTKPQLLKEQANTLDTLCRYFEGIKKCSELKTQLDLDKINREKLTAFFE